MLIKLNLSKHFVSALQIIYSKKTGKAAVEAYVLSPVSIPCPPLNPSFYDLCHDLDELSSHVNMTDLTKTLISQLSAEYADCVTQAAQLVRAFDVEEELNK